MDEKVRNLVDLRSSVDDLHDQIYNYMSGTYGDVINNNLEIEDICDMAFLCRKLELLFDELRKTAKARKELSIKIMGFWLATQSIESPETYKDRIDGELAYARISAKSIPKIPSSSDPVYEEFMLSLGIPEEFLKGGLLKPDFKGVTALVTDMVSKGQDLPPGVEKTWTEYNAHFYERKHKENKDG